MALALEELTNQVLTYLKGTGLTVGLLMNFHSVTLKAGLRRFDLKDGVTTESLGKPDEQPKPSHT
jgi:hypothetical protein